MMKTNTVNNPTEAIEIINHCKEIIRTQHKQVKQYIHKQGEILKIFKETENFFDGSEKSRLTIYFKIAVYKILKKSILNLKSIKLICIKYPDLFSK